MTTRGQFDLFGAEGGVRPAPATAELQALRHRVPDRIRLGTSSWSFPGWAGIVYDGKHGEQTLARAGLAAYARHPLLRAVSIDRTYYAPVEAEVMADYAADVPGDFRFLVKADRLLTDPEATTTTGGSRFLDVEYAVDAVVAPAMLGLGDLLGAIVFQFSPRGAGAHGGRIGFASRLADFLTALPVGPLYAVELRTPALLTRAYAAALEQAGAAHCYTLHASMVSLAEQLRRIPPCSNRALIVRWMLRQGIDYEGARARYEPFDRLVEEDPVAREEIAQAAVACAREERDVIVCINNKAEGSAPLSAVRLAETIARLA